MSVELGAFVVVAMATATFATGIISSFEKDPDRALRKALWLWPLLVLVSIHTVLFMRYYLPWIDSKIGSFWAEQAEAE